MMNALIHTLEKHRTAVLCFILGLGLFLRIFDLGSESLWLDEVAYIKQAEKPLRDLFGDLSIGIHHSPLYFLMLHYWVELFGDSEITTRALSAVFGFLTLFVLYRSGSLIFNKNVGLLSTFLLAISVFHISFSQEVKGYSLLAFLSLLSMYFFLKLLDTFNLKVATGYIIASTLLMYTHYFSVFILAVQYFYFIISLFARNTPRLSVHKWVLLQSILVLLYMPWILWILKSYIFTPPGPEITSGVSLSASMTPDKSLPLYIKSRISTPFPLPRFTTIISTFLKFSGSHFLMWSYFSLAFFSLFTVRRTAGRINRGNLFTTLEIYTWNIQFSDINKFFLLSLWLFFPILLPFVLSFLFTPIYSIRYTIAALLPFYLLAAKGLQNISTKHVKTAVIIILAVLSIGNIHEYYTKVQKQQWRSVAKYLDTNVRDGDEIVFLPGHGKKIVFDYYLKRPDLRKRALQFPLPLPSRKINAKRAKNLQSLVDGNFRVWFIISGDKDPDEIVKKSFQSFDYDVISHKQFDGENALSKWHIIDVFLFQKFVP